MTRFEAVQRWVNPVVVVAGAILAVGFALDGAWWRAAAFTLLTAFQVRVTARDFRRTGTRAPQAPRGPHYPG